MNEIIIAIVGLSGTIILSLVGLYGAKKYNIGPNQEKLVATLKDLLAMQELRIKQLETQAASNAIEIAQLRTDVAKLKDLTVEQALTIGHLEDELSSARRGGKA